MKVYIILDKSNSDDRTFVEKVFSNKEKAVDYLYSGFMRYSFYAGKSKEDLRKEIESNIHEEELE